MGDKGVEVFKEALPFNIVSDIAHIIRASDVSALVNMLHRVNRVNLMAGGSKLAAAVFRRQRHPFDKASAKDKLQAAVVPVMLQQFFFARPNQVADQDEARLGKHVAHKAGTGK